MIEMLLKRILRIIVPLMMVFFSCSALGQSSNAHHLGIILFSPTGFSYEHALSQDHAIDAAVGWSLGDSLRLHGDYLWKRPRSITIDAEKLGYYYGIGARLYSHDSAHGHDENHGHTHFGIRAPLGMEYFFRTAPLQVFLEGALVMEFAPDTQLDLDLGLGLRYCF